VNVQPLDPIPSQPNIPNELEELYETIEKTTDKVPDDNENTDNSASEFNHPSVHQIDQERMRKSEFGKWYSVSNIMSTHKNVDVHKTIEEECEDCWTQVQGSLKVSS